MQAPHSTTSSHQLRLLCSPDIQRGPFVLDQRVVVWENYVQTDEGICLEAIHKDLDNRILLKITIRCPDFLGFLDPLP